MSFSCCLPWGSCWWYQVILKIGLGIPWMSMRITVVLILPGFSRRKTYKDISIPKSFYCLRFSKPPLSALFIFLTVIFLRHFCQAHSCTWHIITPFLSGVLQTREGHLQSPMIKLTPGIEHKASGTKNIEACMPSHTVWACISCSHLMSGWPHADSMTPQFTHLSWFGK